MKCDEFNSSICRSMVAMRDMDHTGTLGLQEFQGLWDDLLKWKVAVVLHVAHTFFVCEVPSASIMNLLCCIG